MRYRNGANKYVVGYAGLGFRGDATLENVNVKVMYIKIGFRATGMEESTYREHVRMKTEGSGLSSGNISELANGCKRKILLRNIVKKITRKEAERESAASVFMGVGRRIFTNSSRFCGPPSFQLLVWVPSFLEFLSSSSSLTSMNYSVWLMLCSV